MSPETFAGEAMLPEVYVHKRQSVRAQISS